MSPLSNDIIRRLSTAAQHKDIAAAIYDEDTVTSHQMDLVSEHYVGVRLVPDCLYIQAAGGEQIPRLRLEILGGGVDSLHCHVGVFHLHDCNSFTPTNTRVGRGLITYL